MKLRFLFRHFGDSGMRQKIGSLTRNLRGTHPAGRGWRLAFGILLGLFTASSMWLAWVNAAVGRGDVGAVRGAKTIVDYRRSGDFPYWKPSSSAKRRRRWTPDEIIGLLEAYPEYYLDMGIRTSNPTGSTYHQEIGRIVNEVQALGEARGVDTSHLMVHFRNDIYVKLPKGFYSCTFCDELGKCDDRCTWEGAMADAPFDPAWILTVPRAEHQWAVDRIWRGDASKDPWSPAGFHLWFDWVDREAIATVNTPTRVAAVYGPVKDRDESLIGRDHSSRVSAVLMDLRKPAYRAWSVKKLIADLDVMGIDPGESAVIQYQYKPGWHTYYAGPDSGDRCFVEGSHMWVGPAGPCLGIKPPGGPFTRTPYGPGEFEAALNALLREMRAGLVAADLAGISIITVERPAYKGKKWSILEPAIRKAPWLIGELESSCDRRKLSLPPNPIRCRSRGR